jgi:hypothetical protein
LLCFVSLVVDLLVTARISPDDRDLEIVLLRQQLRVLERRLKAQSRNSRPEKLMLVALAERLKSQAQQWSD